LASHPAFHSVGASIIVEALAAETYNHWVHVEEFPKFMGSVREVKRMEGDRFYWRVERGGKEYESVSQIVLLIPNRRMAWRTISGAESSGVVGFDPLPGNKTLVSFKMKYVPDAGWEDAGALLERIKRRLANFKTYIESRPWTARQTNN
jgi:uncharacterized membrane protein